MVQKILLLSHQSRQTEYMQTLMSHLSFLTKPAFLSAKAFAIICHTLNTTTAIWPQQDTAVF